MVGGSSEWLEIYAHGNAITIPRQLRPTNSATMHKLYAAINRLVPIAIWTKLKQHHQEYMDTHQL